MCAGGPKMHDIKRFGHLFPPRPARIIDGACAAVIIVFDECSLLFFCGIEPEICDSPGHAGGHRDPHLSDVFLPVCLVHNDLQGASNEPRQKA